VKTMGNLSGLSHITRLGRVRHITQDEVIMLPFTTFTCFLRE